MARGAYIKSSTLEATLQTEQAGTTFQAAALLLQTLNGSNSSEFRAWAERLLGRACLFSRRYTDPPTIQGLSSALRIFTAWGDYWQQTPSRGLQDNAAQSRLDVPRRQVWKLYYGLLSKILQLGLLHAPTTRQDSEFLLLPSKDVSDEQFVASRLHQRAQLKRVEATYESLLMQETQFPKASQWNEEVEFYVEDVIGNWKVLCGSDWSDEELGEGGKDALGRGVLDTLYRAATKTFHSTTILRQLFTVHASLGEFDLAMHAFDSYTEIVGKGKARAEKTGGHEIGFDNDDVALLTAAEAIRLLCRYGDRDQCEKAVEIGKNIQKWLSQVRPSSSKSTAGPEPAQGQSTESNMSSVALAAAYRAVGISRATWARLTYEEERRSEHQAEGLKAMQKAASLDQEDLDSAYALALLLADMRDVPAAIQVLKRALAPQRQSNGDESSTDFSRERRKIPLWHLLALCLTARDDFDNAVKMCEAAFEQFPDPTTLFGQSADPTAGRSRPSRGVVDQMEGFEKENIIQLKITQMTFEELMEGPSIAVDQSDELLSLYARLFGNADTPAPTLKPPGTAATGQTATTKQGGTLRSIAGSIVGRPTTSRRSVEKNAFQPPSEQRTSIGTHPPAADSQAMGAPITIQVTNEEGKTSEKPHHHHHLHMPFKVRGHQGDWREAGNLKSTKSTENLNEKAALEGAEQAPPPPPKDTAVFDHQPTSQSQAVDGAVAHSPSNPDQPIPPIPHNRPHTEQPAPAGHEGQPPVQDTRLPAPHPAASTAPEPRFPSAQNRRQKVSLLVNIWLFVGGLYLRADMFDDAKGAFDEAYKLVEGFELEVAKEDSSARGFFFKGWGGGKGVDELWADVWAEVRRLQYLEQNGMLTCCSEATSPLLEICTSTPSPPSSKPSRTSQTTQKPSSASRTSSWTSTKKSSPPSHRNPSSRPRQQAPLPPFPPQRPPRHRHPSDPIPKPPTRLS